MPSTAVTEASTAIAEAPTASKEVFTVQALRAVAAIMVILRHVDRDKLAFGSMGVDVFFVLSGFVMILSTARLRGQPNAARIFAKRRIVRILPMYWLFTGIHVLRGFAGGQHYQPREIICSLLFIPYRFGQPLSTIYFPIISVGWTLNYEAFFYLCFAICLWIRKSPFWLAPVFVLLAMVGLYQPEQSIGAFSIFNYRLLIFVGGMVIAKLYSRALLLNQIPAAFLVCLCISSVIAWHHDTYWVHMVVWAPVALAGTYALLSFERVFSRTRHPVIQLLGDASYSIYLSHLVLTFAFLHAALRLYPSLPSTIGTFAFALLSVTMACAVGVLVHKIIERPILRYFSVRIGGHRVTS
jgi:exopolysaccharide production protein ExoZ